MYSSLFNVYTCTYVQNTTALLENILCLAKETRWDLMVWGMKLRMESNVTFVNAGHAACRVTLVRGSQWAKAKSPLPKQKQLFFYQKPDRKACIRIQRRYALSARISSETRDEDLDDVSSTYYAQVERRTIAWVRQHVIALNLCPFAEGVLRENSHRIRVSPASTKEGVLGEMEDEMQVLIRASSEEVSTTLLVLPNFAMDDFVQFYDVCTDIESAIECDENLMDQIMLAFFHPLHEWADSHGTDDAINFDKRAPYPVINLLRAPLVDHYIEEGRTQGILERNRDTLARLGDSRLRDAFHSLYLK